MVSVLLDQSAVDLIPAHAIQLLKLDQMPAATHGAMTKEQRARLIDRLREAPIQYPKELIELMFAEYTEQ